AHAFRLFQADRRRFGLAPVTRTSALDAVARGHSEDMARNRFFSHVSPTTGSVSERLRAAGLRTVFHGENIARNETLSDAEAGLMRSIGHRRNILHPRATEVGIGVAQIGSGSTRQWALTQVVARPVPVVDPRRIEREVFEVLDGARERAGQRRFKASKALERAARVEAASESPSPRGVLDRAEGSLTRGGWAWVATLGDLADLQIPEDVLDAGWRKLGVGVVQDPEREGPNIVVVLVLGG
ncbi:MAG: CAP domain-containing protein, partial [Myxococcota bacterium]|nr:CAP domain-containing protein [Myxococcota bacterium]